MTLKKLYSWLKKLYPFITNLFFLLIYQLLIEDNTTKRRISHSIAFVVGRLALWRDICPCSITLAQRYTPPKHGKTSLQYAILRNKYSFVSICFFQSQNKAGRLNRIGKQKSKRSFNVVYCSFLNDFWHNRFLSRVK